MTKKDFASLLIAFLGAWLMFQALISLFEPAFYFAVNLLNGFPGRHGIIPLVIPLIQSLFYFVLALVVIRKSVPFADRLLRNAHITGDEKIEGFSLTGILPAAISITGLYFILTRLPLMAIEACKWFALEAQGTGSISRLGGRDQLTLEYRDNLIFDAAVLAFAVFVFLRADLLASLVEKYRRPPNQ